MSPHDDADHPAGHPHDHMHAQDHDHEHAHPDSARAVSGEWEVALSDDCLDDITLPPGGGGLRQSKDHHVPHPDYLSHEGRDLRIDLLRGFFVLAMIIDHVRGQSILFLITGGNRFYASAAEGFILTSGLVAGIVYKRLIKRDGMSATLMKVLNRAFTLFLLTVGLTFAFTLFSELLGLPWATGVSLADPVGFVVSVFTLHRTYYLVDVMLLYTVLFLVSPLAFVMLDRGKTWLLLLASVILYSLYQFYPDYAALPWSIDGNYLFSFSSWQILFFGGLALGYHQDHMPAMKLKTTRRMMILTGIGFLLLIGAYLLIDTPTTLLPDDLAAVSPIAQDVRVWLQDYIFSKVDLRPGRLIAAAVAFSFSFFLVTIYWQKIKKWVGWLLLPLGQFALNAYTAHIALVGLVGLAVMPLNLESPGPGWFNLIVQIACVLLIWFIVKRQILTPTIRTRLWFNLSPAVMAVLIIVVFLSFPAPVYPGLAASETKAPGGRTPTRYGTPVPRTAAAQPIPATGAQPAPTATPERLVKTIKGSDVLTSDYLDPLAGSFIQRGFYSPELDRDMDYYIYLPPDYAQDLRRYPVLYMLHGLGGHREEWVVYGLINIVDQEIGNGDILPMIVVLPQGDKSYWVNHAKDGERWGEYVVHDLVNEIDSRYRTLRNAHSRAIGGLSMGGYAALSHALTHPNIFGIAGAHSPSLREEGVVDFLGTGKEFAATDPLSLAKSASDLETLRIWLDVGTGDDWLPRVQELNQIMDERGITHTFQTFSGGHDYEYWTDHIIDYVRFYGDALSRK